VAPLPGLGVVCVGSPALTRWANGVPPFGLGCGGGAGQSSLRDFAFACALPRR